MSSQWQVLESHQSRQEYEPRPSTGPPATVQVLRCRAGFAEAILPIAPSPFRARDVSLKTATPGFSTQTIFGATSLRLHLSRGRSAWKARATCSMKEVPTVTDRTKRPAQESDLDRTRVEIRLHYHYASGPYAPFLLVGCPLSGPPRRCALTSRFFILPSRQGYGPLLLGHPSCISYWQWNRRGLWGALHSPRPAHTFVRARTPTPTGRYAIPCGAG